MKRVAEAQSWAARTEVAVEPAPVQHDITIVLVEIRDVQVAVAILHEIYKMPSMPPHLGSSRRRVLDVEFYAVS